MRQPHISGELRVAPPEIFVLRVTHGSRGGRRTLSLAVADSRPGLRVEIAIKDVDELIDDLEQARTWLGEHA